MNRRDIELINDLGYELVMNDHDFIPNNLALVKRTFNRVRYTRMNSFQMGSYEDSINKKRYILPLSEVRKIDKPEATKTEACILVWQRMKKERLAALDVIPLIGRFYSLGEYSFTFFERHRHDIPGCLEIELVAQEHSKNCYDKDTTFTTRKDNPALAFCDRYQYKDVSCEPKIFCVISGLKTRERRMPE